MKVMTRIFLLSLLIVKIVLGSLFIYLVEFDSFFCEGNAIAAQEVQKEPEAIAEPADQAERGGQGEAGLEDKSVVEEEEIDLDFLRKWKAELVKQEEELERKKTALLAIQEDMNKKIAFLTRLRNEIRAEIAKKTTFQEQKLKHVIKAYSAMKPQKAASLIEKLDMDFSIELLSKMKGDTVGNILSFLDSKRAAKISEELAKRK